MAVVGTSKAVRLALVLKMILLYFVVEAVYNLMKKVLDKFVSGVMTPARGGKISLSMLVKQKVQMCLAASYSSAVSGSSFLFLVKLVPKLSTPKKQSNKSKKQINKFKKELEELLFSNCFSFVECISGFTWLISPVLFETASSRISLFSQSTW